MIIEVRADSLIIMLGVKHLKLFFHFCEICTQESLVQWCIQGKLVPSHESVSEVLGWKLHLLYGCTFPPYPSHHRWQVKNNTWQTKQMVRRSEQNDEKTQLPAEWKFLNIPILGVPLLILKLLRVVKAEFSFRPNLDRQGNGNIKHQQ